MKAKTTIRQLVGMLILSVIAGLLFQSHVLYTIKNTVDSPSTYIAAYLAGYAITLTVACVFVALIPKLIYWILNKKHSPDVMILAWSVWVLMIVIMSFSQIYKSVVHNDNQNLQKNTISKKLTAEEIYNNTKNSIFAVIAGNHEGTAVAIDTNYLATNCHIISESDHFTILTKDGEKPGILYSAHGDLCIIMSPDQEFSPIQMRDSKSVSIGEDVYAIGNPRGFLKSISKGIISNKHNVRGIMYLQTDAAISHGSSGGGLFDVNGKLIGITFLKSPDDNDEGLGFVIPTEVIQASLLEPIIPSRPKKQDSGEKIKYIDKAAKIINQYGKDNIMLVQWLDSCFMAIPGRYSSTDISSIAIWFPIIPNKLVVFKHVNTPEKAVEFFNWLNGVSDIRYVRSKSYLYFNESLIPLPRYVVNKINQNAYMFETDKSIAEDLMILDYFVAQFYGFHGQDSITTITFGLSGFTDAYNAYNSLCR